MGSHILESAIRPTYRMYMLLQFVLTRIIGCI